ncbi:molecular chaperone DnaJ [Patescibacteria group bacterium]|nr:molecular chaperone DnaJ [Patescibacteria group bacterium]
MTKNYYEVLGVERGATQEEIKKAFHTLAHKHHPHKGGDEKKFKEINEAYQILSDKERRAQYDQFGQTSDGGGFDPSWFWGKGSNSQSEFDFNDLGDIFGDMFGFSQRGQRKKDVRRGSDIRIEIEIPLEDTIKETKRVFSIKKIISCSRCQGIGAEPGASVSECFSCRGSGYVQQIKRTILGSFTQSVICPECKGDGLRPEKPCNVCKGEGRIKGDEDIELVIPAGIDTNQSMKVFEKGNAGRRAGKTGDLYVRVIVKPHPVFERRGDDLFSTKNISFSQAALGGEADLQLLDKTDILLKVPAGIDSGKVLRISGKGIPHFGGYGRGDLYVELKVKTPARLSKKQKELLEKLKEEGM